MGSPRLTVGMPVRNGAGTLALALASIVGQTFRDWELIVLDDGSTDRSAEVALAAARADARVRLVRGERTLGLAARLNELVARASGALFARMDADDLAYPDRFARQLALLEDDPAIDLVGSAMMVFRADGQARGVRRCPLSHVQICARPERGFRLFHPTWVGRTAWFRQHRYLLTATRCEDQELLYRVHRRSRFANVGEPLLGYREDRTPLAATLTGRRHFAGHVCSALLSDGRPLAAASVVAEQAAKGLAECAVAAAGRDAASLPHRSSSATEAELERWRQVWWELAGVGAR